MHLRFKCLISILNNLGVPVLVMNWLSNSGHLGVPVLGDHKMYLISIMIILYLFVTVFSERFLAMGSQYIYIVP